MEGECVKKNGTCDDDFLFLLLSCANGRVIGVVLLSGNWISPHCSIFRVARSPKTPEQWRNQLHTLMAVVCAVHDEDGSRLEPEGEVRAQGEKVALTTTLEEVVYSRRWFSLQPWALARLLNCRYVDYCLLSKAELHREITSSTQAQVWSLLLRLPVPSILLSMDSY